MIQWSPRSLNPPLLTHPSFKLVINVLVLGEVLEDDVHELLIRSDHQLLALSLDPEEGQIVGGIEISDQDFGLRSQGERLIHNLSSVLGVAYVVGSEASLGGVGDEGSIDSVVGADSGNGALDF